MNVPPAGASSKSRPTHSYAHPGVGSATASSSAMTMSEAAGPARTMLPATSSFRVLAITPAVTTNAAAELHGLLDSA
jgi:hypothetical protein